MNVFARGLQKCWPDEHPSTKAVYILIFQVRAHMLVLETARPVVSKVKSFKERVRVRSSNLNPAGMRVQALVEFAHGIASLPNLARAMGMLESERSHRFCCTSCMQAIPAIC